MLRPYIVKAGAFRYFYNGSENKKSSLRTILVSNKWSYSNSQKWGSVFEGLEQLSGSTNHVPVVADGSEPDKNKLGAYYANYTDGYLTLKTN